MRKKTRLLAKFSLLLFLVAQFYGITFLFPPQTESGNLQNVSDSLSNNRLSFRGEVDGTVAVGGGVISIHNAANLVKGGANTSTGSASLMENENLKIGSNAPIAVKTLESDLKFVMASGLTIAAVDSDPVVSTASATHTVTFTPKSGGITAGAFRVLIQASGSANTADGIPDKGGFDLGAVVNADVACTGGSGFTFNSAWNTATSSATFGSIGGVYYHAFECRYTGDGVADTAVTMTIGAPSGNKLLNPSPSSSSRYPGAADSYTIRVKHLYGSSGSYATVDETFGIVGVVEAVKVTATVPPTLTFQISGRAASTSNCGKTAANETTYNTAPFGNVSTSQFTNIAQSLSVFTNAGGGYVVTASESGLLTANNVTGAPTIANTTCDSTCLYNDAAGQEWNTYTNRGFGYSLEDVAGDCVAAGLEWNYNPGVARVFNARPFGTTGASIMTSTVPADADIARVCYRIVVSGSQAAGQYENYIVYIATATF